MLGEDTSSSRNIVPQMGAVLKKSRRMPEEIVKTFDYASASATIAKQYTGDQARTSTSIDTFYLLDGAYTRGEELTEGLRPGRTKRNKKRECTNKNEASNGRESRQTSFETEDLRLPRRGVR